MNLDGARNAKAEIFRHAFGFIETPEDAARGLPTFVPPVDFRRLLESTSVWRQIGRRFGQIDGDFGGLTGVPNLPLPHRPHGELPDVSIVPPPTPPVAVGIMPPKRRGGDTRLVLFAEDAKLRDHPVVQKALEVAKDAHFVACGENRSLSFWQPARQRPLTLGVSVAHRRVTAGSLGFFAKRRRDGGVGIVSNNHVLANVNNGAPPDEVLQPGPADGGLLTNDVVARLDAFVLIDTSAGAVNSVDCALAAIEAGVEPSAAFAGRTYGMPLALKGSSPADLFEDEAVFKVGRSTGPTQGLVFATEVDNYIVNMGTAVAPLRCRFDNQIQVYSRDGEFASAGDSGSVVFDKDGLARGLLFAGSLAGAPSGFGLVAVNPIASVLAQLDVEVWVA